MRNSGHTPRCSPYGADSETQMAAGTKAPLAVVLEVCEALKLTPSRRLTWVHRERSLTQLGEAVAVKGMREGLQEGGKGSIGDKR